MQALVEEQLGVQTDREVADALGLSDKALNARKARGVFPEDKLFALAAKRPDLGIDVGYVLSGRRPEPALSTQLVAREELGAYSVGQLDFIAACPQRDLLGDALEAVEVEVARVGKVQTAHQRARMAWALFMMSLDARRLNTEAVKALVKLA